jgi:DNA-binding NtrC family response regulator
MTQVESDAQLGNIPETTPEMRRAAALTVVRHAEDKADPPPPARDARAGQERVMNAQACMRCCQVRPICARELCDRCYDVARYRGELIDFPRRRLTRDEFVEEFELLRGQGYTRAQIAERLGMSRNTLDKRLERLGSPYPQRRTS